MWCRLGLCGLRLCIFFGSGFPPCNSLAVVFVCNVFAVVFVLQFFLLWPRSAILFQRSSSFAIMPAAIFALQFLVVAFVLCFQYCVVLALAAGLAVFFVPAISVSFGLHPSSTTAMVSALTL